MPTGVRPRTEEELTRLRKFAFKKGNQFRFKKGHQIGQETRFKKGEQGGHKFEKGHPFEVRFKKGNLLGYEFRFPKGYQGYRHPKGYNFGYKFESKHGLYYHSLYRVWQAMIQRCTNPKNGSYPRYGEKGIKIWDHWLDPAAFICGITVLLVDLPKGYTIDRVNPHEGYYEWNVRWADRQTQRRNRRKNVLDYFTQSGEH